MLIDIVESDVVEQGEEEAEVIVHGRGTSIIGSDRLNDTFGALFGALHVSADAASCETLTVKDILAVDSDTVVLKVCPDGDLPSGGLSIGICTQISKVIK